MEKIARCKHVDEVEIEANWDDGDRHLIRVCQDCGRVMGYNKEIQQWQFLSSMRSLTFALRRSEMVHRKTSDSKLKTVVQKSQEEEMRDIKTVPVKSASSDLDNTSRW